MKRLTSRADSPSVAPSHLFPRRSIIRLLTIGIILSFTSQTITSCIFDSPNDSFYRTLWVSGEAPFSNPVETAFFGDEDSHGPDFSGSDGGSGGESGGGSEGESSFGDSDGGSGFSSDPLTRGTLTIEFLCGSNVRVTATGAVGSYGTYDHHGTTAYFSGLHLTYHSGIPDTTPAVIILEEAHRTDDLLLISWHYSGSAVSYTTRLLRKSSYE